MRAGEAINACLATINVLVEKKKVRISLRRVDAIYSVEKINLESGEVRLLFTGSRAECFAFLEGMYDGMEVLV